MSPDASPGSGRAAREKLDSWKQIASYLEREVRTVQRWEKSEGLPVHRHQHGARGTVFAFREEIDRWLEGRTQVQAGTAPPTPAPEQPAPGQPVDDPPQVRARRLPLSAALVLVLLVVTVGLLLFDRLGLGGRAVELDSRLLVLPLATITDDPLEQSTGRALHEELITGLARLAPERLALIGRTSALRYGSTELGLAEIGEALGVDHVLEGSIRRREGSLRVTARLVRAREENEIWSGAFVLDTGGAEGSEHPAGPGDLGAEEERVVAAVCAAIASELLGEAATAPAPMEVDPAAREAWLRGRYLWHKGTHEGYLASLPHFEQALSINADFVGARVGLANAYVQLGRYGILAPREVFPKARTAALAAIELDPGSAEAHAALAMIHFYYDWDFEAAAESFQRALRLGPELALTHHSYGHFLSCLGLHDLGLESALRARALEPLWPQVIVDTAWFHYRARNFEEAAAESRRALELEPGMQGAVLCLVGSLRELGDEASAWNELRSHLDAAGRLAEIPGVEGEEPAQALRNVRLWARAELERLATERFVSTHAQVFSLIDLDRDDEVLDCLESSIETRDRVALLTQVHPAFDDLRQSPRFQEFIARVGFPDDAAGLIERTAGR